MSFDRTAPRMPREARRAQLIDAARNVFVAQGYHAAAMDDIADRAGVSKPVLYQHFPGKLDLYLALLELSGDQLIEAVRAALASTSDNRDRVQAAVGAYFEFVNDPDGAYRLVFESDLTNEPSVRDRVEAVEDACTVAIAHVIAEDTDLSEDEATLLAIAIAGTAETAARRWLREGKVIPIGHAVALVNRLVWRGISGVPRSH